MERRTVTRVLRAVRRRKGWSQRLLGQRIGISKSEMSRWENGALTTCTVGELERWASALGGHLVLDVRIDGERPLTDARHARVQSWLVRILRGAGWVVEAEVSFNHYGDRGRIDVLAYHPGRRILLVVEIKTEVHDIQDILGRLDTKRRIAPTLAGTRGWQPQSIVAALFVHEGATNRRRIAAHADLFDPYSLRARAAVAWLRHPDTRTPGGILCFVTPQSE
jgi:transcriptional regulator with XRE-family HTH domain